MVPPRAPQTLMRPDGWWRQVRRVAAATVLHPAAGAGFAAGVAAGAFGRQHLAGFALGAGIVCAGHRVRAALTQPVAGTSTVRFVLHDAAVVALQTTGAGDVVADLVAGELRAVELDGHGSVLSVERGGPDAVPVVVPTQLLGGSGGTAVLTELERCEASGHPAQLTFEIGSDGEVRSFEVVRRRRVSGGNL